MRPRGTDAIPLPARPNIEQYRNRAKALVKACASGEADAVRAWARHWLEALRDHVGAIATARRAEDPPTRFTEREIAKEVDAIEKDARSSHLIGDGPDRGAAEDEARQLGVAADVRFPGKIDAVAPLLAAADLYIFPSETESFGLSASRRSRAKATRSSCLRPVSSTASPQRP